MSLILTDPVMEPKLIKRRFVGHTSTPLLRVKPVKSLINNSNKINSAFIPKKEVVSHRYHHCQRSHRRRHHHHHYHR